MFTVLANAAVVMTNNRQNADMVASKPVPGLPICDRAVPGACFFLIVRPSFLSIHSSLVLNEAAALLSNQFFLVTLCLIYDPDPPNVEQTNQHS